MGYTRYWKRTEEKITQEFVDDVNKILEDCKKKGICIRDGWGEDEPIVTLNGIYINGNAQKGLDHETFSITNEPSNFEFCKTARKPYDYAVREILNKAKEYGLVSNVSSDDAEQDKVIQNDAQYLGEDLKPTLDDLVNSFGKTKGVAAYLTDKISDIGIHDLDSVQNAIYEVLVDFIDE